MSHNSLVSLFYPVVFYQPCLEFEWDLMERISIAIDLPAYTVQYIGEPVKEKVLGRDEADYLNLEQQGLKSVQEFLETSVTQRAMAAGAPEVEKWVVSNVSRILLTSNFVFARILYRITSSIEELRPRFLTAWIGWVRKMFGPDDYRRLIEGLFASLLSITVDATVDFFRHPFKSYYKSMWRPYLDLKLSYTLLLRFYLLLLALFVPATYTADATLPETLEDVGPSVDADEALLPVQFMEVDTESPIIPVSVSIRGDIDEPSTHSQNHPQSITSFSDAPRSPLRSVHNIVVDTPVKSKSSLKKPISGSTKRKQMLNGVGSPGDFALETPVKSKPSLKRPITGSIKKKQRLSRVVSSSGDLQFVVPGVESENMDE
ncbi:hypothetical protein D9758_005873 [Tetrapyrgos nigripes]|uniref:Uncharacterized protein n=1 Tax=Tetrapyrgos nigripes TaxID=182062 RepID=A0A8H5G366_9AGAR|nr:hypothetical protein D9758_005873 [Tetrapyrgos nigripes]